MNRPVCYQAIVTSFYAPTNHRAARLKITAATGTKWKRWDELPGSGSDNDRHIYAAREYAQDMGWAGIWHMGGLPDGSRVFVNNPIEISAPAFIIFNTGANQKHDAKAT